MGSDNKHTYCVVKVVLSWKSAGFSSVCQIVCEDAGWERGDGSS